MNLKINHYSTTISQILPERYANNGVISTNPKTQGKNITRRKYLSSLGLFGLFGLAGCLHSGLSYQISITNISDESTNVEFSVEGPGDTIIDDSFVLGENESKEYENVLETGTEYIFEVTAAEMTERKNVRLSDEQTQKIEIQKDKIRFYKIRP